MSPPKVKDTLAERILSEVEVQRVLAKETNPRDRAMLRLLYSVGLRVSELCALKWRDLICRGTLDKQHTLGQSAIRKGFLEKL